MGMVIVILLMTFIAIKKFSPVLPEEENQIEARCATTSRWFGEIFCLISFCSFTLGMTLIDPPIPVLFQFLFNLILKVGCPAFYIYCSPSHSVYVNTFFKKNVLNPINESKEIVSQFFSKFSFRQTPQIDVNV